MREFTVNSDGQAIFKEGRFWFKVIALPLCKELSRAQHQAILEILNGHDSTPPAQADASERMAEALEGFEKAVYRHGLDREYYAVFQELEAALQAYKESKK